MRNHRWKALEVYYPKIFMHANGLWPKFANFSCRENVMFYSILQSEWEEGKNVLKFITNTLYIEGVTQ